MANINTKTLNELTVIQQMDNNDKVLVESNGSMKRLSKKLAVGDGIFLFDFSVIPSSNTIHDTTTFNKILEALDRGKLIHAYGPLYYETIGVFAYRNGGNDPYVELQDIRIFPSIDYSQSELYQPVNLTFNSGLAV